MAHHRFHSLKQGQLLPTGCGIVTITPNGNFNFTAPAGFTGPCTFEFEVIDSNTCFATADVTILVSPPLVVSNGTFCTCSNVPFTNSLASLVSGGLPPYTFILVGTPIGGTVFLDPLTGLFTFMPNPGFMGFASFQFMVMDSNHPPCVSNIGTVIFKCHVAWIVLVLDSNLFIVTGKA